MPRGPGRKANINKARNLGNLHIIKPNANANRALQSSGASLVNVPASSDVKLSESLISKASPSKEIQQKELFVANKTVDNTKTVLTDCEMSSPSNEFRVTRSVSLKLKKNLNLQSNELNICKNQEKKYSSASKKMPKSKDLSHKEEILASKKTRVTARDFFELEERRVVRMKESSNSRRDFIEQERMESKRDSSRKTSRTFSGERTVSRRESRAWDSSGREKKGSSTSRSFSSRREEEKYFKEKYQSSRRESNKRSRNYKWDYGRDFEDDNPYQWYRKGYEVASECTEEKDHLDEVSDGPLEEADFEEVEVASVEDANKGTEIPVGFRKYELKYLHFKRSCFFKPKRYFICPERTIVNCLSMIENAVDVAPEVEHDGENKLTKIKSPTKVDNPIENAVIAEIDGKENNEKDGEIISEENHCTDTKMIKSDQTDTSDNSVNNISSKDISCIEKSNIDSSQNTESIKDVDSCLGEDVDASSVNKVVSMEIQNSDLHNQPRVYRKCIPELDANQEFFQGPAKIQGDLDAWKSHLIGLEFVIEILDSLNGANVKKYFCGLCVKDILHDENAGQSVIEHLNKFDHMCTYMARHFPSCGYKFSENTRNYNNQFVLSKCCEEVNNKFGYNFMCITSNDYFMNHYKDIEKIFNNINKREKNVKIDMSVHWKQLQTIISNDVATLIDNATSQILPGEEIATFITSRNVAYDSRKKARRSNVCIDIHNSNTNDPGAKEMSLDSGRTLILLTPQHGSSLKCASVSASPVHSNLVQVPTQPITTPNSHGVSNKKSDKISTKKVGLKHSEKDHISSSKVLQEELSSTESSVKPSPKNSDSLQNCQLPPNTSGQVNEGITNVRTVRKVSKGNSDISIIESKCEKNTKIKKHENYLVNVGDIEINTPTDSAGEHGESDVKHPDIVDESEISINIKSDVNEFAGSKVKGSCKPRSHQKTTQHSKYCIKRILGRSTSSKSNKESTKKESSKVSEMTESITQVFDDKDDSNSVKIIDELTSQDSRHSNSSLRRERSPISRNSRSPSLPYELSRRLSRSPIDRHSRSPNKRRSRSPLSRFSRNLHRRRSRSPTGRYSRSPVRRYSRSPVRRHSRSPIRRHSRSPFGRRSRSPVRRRSRSPLRKRSRSPYRRSRSPIRRRSRSPLRSSRFQTRKRSRSPFQRTSRRYSRSPRRRSSKSPIRRSPSKRYSRSPVRRHSKSPLDAWRASMIESRSLDKNWRDLSPPFKRSRKSFSTTGSIPKHLSSKYSHPGYIESDTRRNMSDLDSISDEDESTYFSTSDRSHDIIKLPEHLDEIMKLPEPTQSMIMQLLQKYTSMNPKDPSFSNFMQFVNKHRDTVASQNPSALSEMFSSNSEMKQSSREAFLQHCLLSNLATNRAKQGASANLPSFTSPPGSSGIPFSPSPGIPGSSIQIPYQQPNVPPFIAPNIMQHGRPQINIERGFQSNLQSHPTSPASQYHEFRQQNHPLSHQRNAPSEIIFKDLKATVNKLFGANEGNPNEGMGHVPVPSMIKSDPEKWRVSQAIAHQFNVPKEFYNPDIGIRPPVSNYPKMGNPGFPQEGSSVLNKQRLPAPPPDAKVSFCDVPRAQSVNKNLFPVIRNPDMKSDIKPNLNVMNRNAPINVNEAKISLAQRLAAVLVKCGMVDVSASLLQEMLMKIGAFSLNPPQDINEAEILDILRKLQYVA